MFIMEKMYFKEYDQLKMFLQYLPVDINSLNEDGIGLLHYAAIISDIKCAKMLINNGADIDLIDRRGCHPVDYVYSMENLQLRKYLIKFSRNLEKKQHFKCCFFFRYSNILGN